MKNNLILILTFLSILNISTVTKSKIATTISLYDLTKKCGSIRYSKYNEPIHLEFEIFPLASSPDSTWHNPIIPETFALSVPQGRFYSSISIPQEGICSSNGTVLFDDLLINELLWTWSPLKKEEALELNSLPELKKISGKVAVITQDGYHNYYHWMIEVLPKLAILESKKIDYDWLYVPPLQPFMRETLMLMNIDPKKIIEATDNHTYIEADELIVPSYVSLSCFTPRWVVDYLRNKFIPAAEHYAQKKDFEKKIFISRTKASSRRILNEDEVFSLFEKEGFKRYNLEELSFAEQLLLFKNATSIVAPHGAGLANLIFSSANTHVIEIFQEREDCTFWYLSQVVGLKHTCIKTTEFKENGFTDTFIPLALIETTINSLPETS